MVEVIKEDIVIYSVDEDDLDKVVKELKENGEFWLDDKTKFLVTTSLDKKIKEE